MITFYNSCKRFHIGFRKLRRDHLRDLLRCMLPHKLHSHLKTICKLLYYIRILFQIAGFCAVRSIRHISGLHPKRSNHMTGSLLFQSCSRRLKLYCKIRRVIPCKSCCRRTEINTLINGKILLRVKSVLFQNILKNHFRHTAFSSPKHFLALQITPLKIRHLFPCHQEISRPLSQLRKVHRRVCGAFLICVNRGLRSHKSNIRFPGDQSCQNLIRSKTSHQFHIQTLVCKIPLFNGNVLRRIKNRMGNLI